MKKVVGVTYEYSKKEYEDKTMEELQAIANAHNEKVEEDVRAFRDTEAQE